MSSTRLTGALAKLAATLAADFGSDSVSLCPDTLRAFAADESHGPPSLPGLVFWASSTAHIERALSLCSALEIPVTPSGARTGKSGGAIPTHGGLALSLERMNRILDLSPGDMVAVCEPGVITADLIRAAQSRSLFYPPDPASLEECTLGGNVAENAGGPRAFKYGVTGDYVLGLEVVLMSGERLRTGHRSIKGVAGYDLTSLFVGSEGTLGVVSEITLKLLPLPREVATALFAFPSVAHAARAVSAILDNGFLPRTLELLDDTAIRAVNGPGVDLPPNTGAALILELDGDERQSLQNGLTRLARTCELHGLCESRIATDEGDRQRLWQARQRVARALKELKPLKFSEDIAVPRSRIEQAIERVKALGAQCDLLTATYGHAGDGNLHVNFLYDREEQIPRVERAVEGLMDIALELCGTITGEHGVGVTKKRFLPKEIGDQSLHLHRQLKKIFDPKGLLNPAKIFE